MFVTYLNACITTLARLSYAIVMIQPPFFIFHSLPKSFPLCHQPLSQHVHNKHHFDTSPLPTSPCHPHHHLWIYAHPVHPVPPSLMSYPSQMSLTLWMLTCKHRLVPPKPSTFGKPSTVPRSTPLRPKIEPHHLLRSCGLNAQLVQNTEASI